MEIKKLTITPITKGCIGFSVDYPSLSTATTLITERMLYQTQNEKIPKVMKKIPKFLRGWVNMETYIGSKNSTHFFTKHK